MNTTSFAPLVVPWLRGLIPFLIAFLLLLFIDLILGSALAWKKKKFDLEKFPEFLQNGLLYLLAWITSEILAFVVPVLLAIEITGYAEAIADITPKIVLGIILVGKYVGSIRKNLKAILAIDNPEPWPAKTALEDNGQDIQ